MHITELLEAPLKLPATQEPRVEVDSGLEAHQPQPETSWQVLQEVYCEHMAVDGQEEALPWYQ